MREELQEIKRHIYEDGSVSDGEVKLLRDVFRRYGAGEEEARLLLDLNTILDGVTHIAAFDELFVETVTGYVVEAGAVTADKWAWLAGHILRDGTVNALERKLLAALAAQGIALPATLAANL
jgi:hypothetical protein